jgi:phytanoyl-CoA hydroxylase
MKAITKFSLNEKNAIQDYYSAEGYVVIENAINSQKIDNFIDSYKAICKNPFFVYYSQSTHVGTRPIFNEFGFIKESMQNASRLAFFRDFCSRMQTCIYDKNVSNALSFISGENKHISWQNMFFDQSTGTVDHQDSWYLDTEPAGNLIGVWYALEDISIHSGAFFVIPSSHKYGLIDREKFPEHDSFVNEVKKLIASSSLEKKLMTLSKGDIILWHPYLIHGALSCQDQSFSRKSFTSHFYPYSFTPKDIEKGKLLSVYDHKNLKSTENHDIYTAYRFNDYFFNALVYGLYFKDKLLSFRKTLSMRREDYDYV